MVDNVPSFHALIPDPHVSRGLNRTPRGGHLKTEKEEMLFTGSNFHVIGHYIASKVSVAFLKGKASTWKAPDHYAFVQQAA